MEHACGPVFSNLAKACEKQSRTREAELFWKVADYFDGSLPGLASGSEMGSTFAALSQAFQYDEDEFIAPASAAATDAKDRGALRMAVWSSKVNAIQKSVAERYAKQGDALLEGKSIFICEACGFIFIGMEAPEICPVCKAPRLRFSQIS